MDSKEIKEPKVGETITMEEFQKLYALKRNPNGSLLGSKQKQNYFQRVGSAFKQSGQNLISDIKQQSQTIQQGADELNPLKVLKGEARAGLRTVGAVANVAMSPITEAPGIKQGIDLLGKGISKIPGASNVIEKGMGVANKYPELAKDVGNIADIATLGVGKVAEKPVAKGLENATEKTVAGTKNYLRTKALNEAVELLDVNKNKKESIKAFTRAEEAGGVTKKGIKGQYSIKPSERDIEVAKDVATIISKRNNPIKNVSNIKNEIKRVAGEEVRPFLQESGQTYAPYQLEEYLNQIKKPLLFGANPEQSKIYNMVRKQIVSIAQRHPRTMEGLWDARQAVDDMIEKQFGDAIFDSPQGSAVRRAALDMRTGINDFIADGLGNEDMDLVNKVNGFIRVARHRGIKVDDPSLVKAEFEKAWGVPPIPDGEFKSAFWKAKLRQMNNMYMAIDKIAEKNYKKINTTYLKRWIQENPGKAKALGVVGGTVGTGVVYGLIAKSALAGD